MNDDIKTLYCDYLKLTRSDQPTAAAVLTLAEILSQPTTALIETDNTVSDGTVSVQEAARRSGTSSRAIYQQCLSGQMRCTRRGGRLRIPLDEIENHL